MKTKSARQQFKMEIVTESLNGRVVVLECTELKSGKAQQSSLIKVINLIGEWPEGPTVLKRKNYPTLFEFVRFNTKKQQRSQFIKNTIKDLMRFSNPQILINLPYKQGKIIPTQIFVSNSGHRLSFWLNQNDFGALFNILTQLEKVSLLKDFEWLSPQRQQLYSNQIEYGSENFINLIQKLSLQSITQIMSMKDYIQNEVKQISQSFHNVFSLANYNYRYFYPPKDATRFLKKTSAVVLLSKQELKQQKSNKWAESVLLQSIFQLRPTFVLSQILARFQGPLYLEKYVFSQKFYSSIEEIYFLRRIQDYFHEDNIRNDLKYLTYVSRVFPDNLLLKQSQQKIQKLRKQGWLQKQVEFSLQSTTQDEVEQDSGQEEEIVTNKQQGDIAALYKKSREQLMKELGKELSHDLNLINQNLRQNNSLDQVQQENVKLSKQILQITESCLHLDISSCISCGFSNSIISNDQKSLNQFLTMFNQGSDRFCLSCADLSIKDKILSQKQRIKQQLQQKFMLVKNQQSNTSYLVTLQLKDQLIQQTPQIKSQQNLMNKKQTHQQASNQNNRQTNLIQKAQIEQKVKVPSKLQKDQKQSIINESQNVKQNKMYTSQSFIQTQQKILQKSQQKSNNFHVQMNMPRQVLFGQKYFAAWALMALRLMNQTSQSIEPEFMHDSLQLSKISGPLSSSLYISNELLDIYHYYFNNMIQFWMRFQNGAENQINSIPYRQKNIVILSQRKYIKVQSNIIKTVFSQTLKTKKQTSLFSLENQQQYLTDNLYAFLQIKLQVYKSQISQHYKTYKNVMNQQYRVTEIELKEMIVKFQQDLKNSIIKTTQQFLLTSRWIVLFISEYTEFKTLQIKKNEIQPQDPNDIVYFINQIEFLLNLIATFVHVFNQPGQIKIIEQAQNQILNLVILLIQNQKQLQKHSNLPSQTDFQVVGILISDMLDHFVSKKSSQASQDAKKLTNKHFTKLKSTLQTKLKTLTVKSIVDFHHQIKNQQMKIASQCLMAISNKDILTVKNLYLNGQLNQISGFFSSLLYLEKQFNKNYSSFLTNQQVKAHVALMGMAMKRCLKNIELTMKSKSEPQHQIKFSQIYKLILESIQKPQQAAELMAVYRSGNKILIDLTNYLLSASFKTTDQSQQNEQIAKNVKLYIQRVRHRHLRYTANTIKNYAQILEIIEFLFKNRNSFFDIQNETMFETQFHMIVQIVILNSLPLYNIELAYKSQLKDINKQLRHFDVNDHYNQIEDYYLTVVSYRHDKAKQKRKKQIQTKKQKSQKNT